MVRWVKAQGANRDRLPGGARIRRPRPLDEAGIVSESQAGQVCGRRALTTLERRIDQVDLPVQTVRKAGCDNDPQSHGGGRGKAAGRKWPRSTHKVSVPISAAERRFDPRSGSP